MKRNILYAQSGGVTPVINATACGVIETARNNRERIGKVFAGKDGIIGVLREELIDTGKESRTAIAALRHTPGGAFGSCRYKLSSIEESKREYERLIEVFEAHDIGYFFYNGGGDSADTAHKVSQIGKKMGYPVQCIGVPKTIDNDLPITDNCPGFGSVAKYVAVSILEASLDVESMASSSTKVFILEVMGRHAGWIAASSGLAARAEGDPPHVILFPEVPFRNPRACATVAGASWPTPVRGMPSGTRSWAAWPPSSQVSCARNWVTSAIGRCRIICSVRLGTWRPKWTWSRRTRWARLPSNWPSRARAASCR
jgi:6-phosphofructokinase 1